MNFQFFDILCTIKYCLQTVSRYFVLLTAPCIFPVLLAAESAPAVVVFEVNEIEWFDTIEGLGTLRANESVVLTATVADTITKINFEDGQRVDAGYVLAEMTSGEESALVNEMTVRLEEADRQFKRLKNLPKGGAVSESLYDEREREYQAARAQLDGMRSRLQDRIIIAPFAGVVGLRNISVGALVQPGDEIVTLTDDSLMKLDFSVPSIFLSKLQTGLPILAKTAAFPAAVFEGEVTGIDSRVDPGTRAIAVRAEIPNGARLLIPGLLMNVTLRYNPRRTLVIPEEALLPAGKQNDVFIVTEETLLVKKQRISIGTRRDGMVEVVEGVAAGEKVITHGTMVAQPEKPVSIKALQQPGEGIQDILHRQGASE